MSRRPARKDIQAQKAAVRALKREIGLVDSNARRKYIRDFHRAFDRARGTRAEALEQLVACGVRAVLTAGGPGDAPGNLAGLRDLTARAGGRLAVVAGGGVRAASVPAIAPPLPDPMLTAAWIGRPDRLTQHGAGGRVSPGRVGGRA